MQSIVDELQSQFSVYEQSQDQVEHILQNWDRAQGLLLVPLPIEEAPAVSEEAITEKVWFADFQLCFLYNYW